jgi:hypothetical protein
MRVPPKTDLALHMNLKIVYGSIFFIPAQNPDTFLTSDPAAKKRDLGESRFVF